MLVFFVDTGFHFPETLDTLERIQIDSPLMLRSSSELTVKEQAQRHGDELYVINPNQCCAIRKVEPTSEC